MNITLDQGIELLDGTMFSYLYPEAADITIEHIAVALSNNCRFAGHVRYHYSIAQHAYNVSVIVPAEHALAGLLHDTAEAFTNDLPTPLKVAIPVFKDLEVRIEMAMAERFGFEFPLAPEVKLADLQMLKLEKEMLKPAASHWEILDGVEDPLDLSRVVLTPLSPEQAKRLFLHRYEELTSGVR